MIYFDDDGDDDVIEAEVLDCEYSQFTEACDDVELRTRLWLRSQFAKRSLKLRNDIEYFEFIAEIRVPARSIGCLAMDVAHIQFINGLVDGARSDAIKRQIDNEGPGDRPTEKAVEPHFVFEVDHDDCPQPAEIQKVSVYADFGSITMEGMMYVIANWWPELEVESPLDMSDIC